LRRYSLDYMNRKAVVFDADITAWDTMQGLDSQGMFSGADAWLLKYDKAGDISDDDVDGPPSAWA
jgi:hypothetical protein